MTPVVDKNPNCEIVAPVFTEYREILTRFIRSRVSDISDGDALLSEVLLKIHKHCDKLGEIRNTEAWLITIAKNTITDYFREKQKRQTSSLHFELAAEEEPDLFRQLEDCVPSLIKKLPAKYAGPLADHELKGIPQKQLASIYNLSESGLKSRVQRGRKMLKSLFKDYCSHLIEGGEDCGPCEC